MRRQVGAPRSLTQQQIRQVLRWHARYSDFHSRLGTLASLSQELGVSLHTIRRALKGSSVPVEQLSSQQWLKVNRWRRLYRRFRATQPSAEVLARLLGVSRTTVFDCLRRKGRYTQRDQHALQPEHGETRGTAGMATRAARRDADNTQRAALLRAWRSVDSGPARLRTAPRPGKSRKVTTGRVR